MPEPINPRDHSLGELNEWRLAALAEAIRQTFERDATNAAAEPDFEGDRKFISDPDTEIDRQARLIVDGEYRRRAEAAE